MSKGSARRPMRVGSDIMADNWQNIFTPKRRWECRLLDGTVIGAAGTFEEARELGLDSTTDDVTFSVVESTP